MHFKIEFDQQNMAQNKGQFSTFKCASKGHVFQLFFFKILTNIVQPRLFSKLSMIFW